MILTKTALKKTSKAVSGLRPADFMSKSLSVAAIAIFALMIGLTAYLPSILKGEISKDIFTISQSLAYSNKPAFICMIVLFYGIITYLIQYRGPQKYLIVRLFLILLMCALIITILWVTTYYNQNDHYILAGIIFTSLVIYIILTSMVLLQGQKTKSCGITFILYLIPILAIIGFFGLLISRMKFVSDKVVELFPSFENYMIIVQFASVLTLGFF